MPILFVYEIARLVIVSGSSELMTTKIESSVYLKKKNNNINNKGSIICTDSKFPITLFIFNQQEKLYHF